MNSEEEHCTKRRREGEERGREGERNEHETQKTIEIDRPKVVDPLHLRRVYLPASSCRRAPPRGVQQGHKARMPVTVWQKGTTKKDNAG
jgi:hypothetical protein